MRNAGRGGITFVRVLAMFAALVSTALGGCSGSGSSSSNNGGGGGGTNSNMLAMSVNTGPAVSAGTLATNSAFTSITVCVPASTSQCQTIDGILVDTGSFGVRVLSSALTLTLPQQKDASGNPIAECTPFVSDETWGPIHMADLTIGSETAKGQAIQVIGGGSGAMATPRAWARTEL